MGGFTGADCSVASCPNDCLPGGSCINHTCVCAPGWTHFDCSIKICENDCSGNGYCENGTCVCSPKFRGSDCSIPMCLGNCSDNGLCLNGTCLCYPEYAGTDCQVHQENVHVPVKCALNCVHGCLGKCAHAYSNDGVGPSRQCYVQCTRECLPACVGSDDTTDGTVPADMNVASMSS